MWVRNESEGSDAFRAWRSQMLPWGAGLWPGTQTARGHAGLNPSPAAQKVMSVSVFEARH